MMKGKIACARASWIGQARFRYSLVTTKDNNVFARSRDAWAFGRVMVYDQLAHGTFAQVGEQGPKEMRVEECAR